MNSQWNQVSITFLEDLSPVFNLENQLKKNEPVTPAHLQGYFPIFLQFIKVKTWKQPKCPKVET